MDDLAAQLGSARLPADVAGFFWTDALAWAAVGVLLGCVLALLLSPLLIRRRSPRAEVARQLAALSALPPGDRLFGQARLLAGLGGDPAQIPRGALYAGQAGDVDATALDRQILRLAARQRV